MGAGFAVVSGAVGTVAEHRKSDSLALGRLSRVAPSVDPPPGMREGVALLETLPAVSFQCPVPDTPYCRPYSSFRVARATVPTLLGDRGEATHTVCVFYIGGNTVGSRVIVKNSPTGCVLPCWFSGHHPHHLFPAIAGRAFKIEDALFDKRLQNSRRLPLLFGMCPRSES